MPTTSLTSDLLYPAREQPTKWRCVVLDESKNPNLVHKAEPTTVYGELKVLWVPAHDIGSRVHNERNSQGIARKPHTKL
ncbi:hypothetical protein N7455_001021 [Penicillium solitum]|uniref:uncharacterized protein n=1 Tax=Penicillium solitum TaxID=60172 RepID=UPI0032C495DD|nr:hypothetical protein N7536_006499 [Penicillium majusculum]KAJ5877556.1 hypothetical protein N7455_001021 [Penicillium solitum]